LTTPTREASASGAEAFAASSLDRLLAERARARPDAGALSAPGFPLLTYAELHRFTRQCAARLREAGLGREDIVALGVLNGPEAASAFLALAAAAVCAPLNPLLREQDYAAYLRDLGARAVLVDEETAAVERAAASLGIQVLRLKRQRERGSGWFDIESDASAPARGDREARSEDVALILPTSGTVSRPKLVPLSHRNLCVSAWNVAHTLRLETSDRCLSMMPLFHIHGLVGGLLATVSTGGFVICTPGFVARDFAGWLREEAPTWYSAVPTIHQAVLGCAEPIRASTRGGRRLRFVRSSSASLPPRVLAALEELFEAPVIEAYGMTEAAHQMASNPLPPGAHKAGSVGPPAGPEMAVVDEQGAPVEPGAMGEIVIRGANVTRGYLKNEAANREAYRDGWFRTGDQGRMDEDGYLVLTGRTKELINRGGEKIAPREVEEALLEHPRVAQAVSFAIPHRTLGEDVGAAVILKSGERVGAGELRRFAASRLAAFKVPRVIRLVEEIPKGATGKAQRIGLAEVLGIGEGDGVGDDQGTPAGALEKRLARVWEEVLRVERVGATDDFFALGGDSLAAIEVWARIAAEEGIDLPEVSLYEHPTVRTLTRAVEAARSRPRRPNEAPQTLVTIRDGGTKPPLFCLPAHDNTFGVFCRIARHLPLDQPMYGLALPRPGPPGGTYTIRQLASEYLPWIRQVQPAGPYHLLGHCHGGYGAFEVARQLEALGEKAEFLCLMDTYLPPTRQPIVGSQRRFQIHRWELSRRSPLEKLTYLWERVVALSSRLRLEGEIHWYQVCVRRGWQVPASLQSRDVVHRLAARSFEPEPYRGRVLLVRGEDDRSEAGWMGWQPWLEGGVEILRVVVTRHGLAAREAVDAYAPQLALRLEAAVERSRRS
jgi:acyl-CoA synthetase (AMP-forming)/AMP-acid ligase II/thioesterase domain-containing protein/acyl carrier protein